MTEATKKVVGGFARLSSEERAEAVKEMNKLINATGEEKKEIQVSFSKRAGLDLGPTNEGGRPCCGR